MRKIDAFAHILPPSYARRLESIMSGSNVSERILGYQQWIHEDPALTDLDARWRAIEEFEDYVQVLTLAVPPLDQLGEPAPSSGRSTRSPAQPFSPHGWPWPCSSSGPLVLSGSCKGGQGKAAGHRRRRHPTTSPRKPIAVALLKQRIEQEPLFTLRWKLV